MVQEVKAFQSDDGKVYATHKEAHRADIMYWFTKMLEDDYSSNTLSPGAIADKIVNGKSGASNIRHCAKKLVEAIG